MAISPSEPEVLQTINSDLIAVASFLAVKEHLINQLSVDPNSNMQSLRILINGEEVEVTEVHVEPKRITFTFDGRRFVVENSKLNTHSALIKKNNQPEMNTEGVLKADIPGVICTIALKLGERVKIGTEILRLEAMKMQNVITANRDGVLEEIFVVVGQEVLEGQALVKIN